MSDVFFLGLFERVCGCVLVGVGGWDRNRKALFKPFRNPLLHISSFPQSKPNSISIMTSDYSMSPDLIPEIALPRCAPNLTLSVYIYVSELWVGLMITCASNLTLSVYMYMYMCELWVGLMVHVDVCLVALASHTFHTTTQKQKKQQQQLPGCGVDDSAVARLRPAPPPPPLPLHAVRV